MKRWQILYLVWGFVLLLLAVLVGVLIRLAPPVKGGRASVSLLAVTNDSTGNKFAVLRFTNAAPVRVMRVAHSLDYKTGGEWFSNQPVPGTVHVDLQYFSSLAPGEGRDVALRFPTNGPWRFRLRFHEQPRGARGAVARLDDLKETIINRAEHTSYTGESYLSETGEIPLER